VVQVNDVDAAEVERVVGKLRRIPSAVRRFALTPERARADYRIDAGLLAAAMTAGLPHVFHGAVPLFDDYDLNNLSLYLRLRSPRWAVMRYWASVLGRPPGETRRYRIDYVLTCPVPGHWGECEFLCCTPGDGEQVVRGAADGTAVLLSATVDLRNDWPPLPAALVDLIGSLSGVEFFRLPDGIKWDVEFMLREKIGDCVGIARYLAVQGARRGLRTRTVFGLIVAPPYSTPHFWVEAHIRGRWVPADPGLIQGMTSWGLLSSGWPADRSPGAFLVPVTTRHGFAASHRGVAATVSFPTRAG
jgi:hypothetical protein